MGEQKEALYQHQQVEGFFVVFAIPGESTTFPLQTIHYFPFVNRSSAFLASGPIVRRSR